MAGSSCSPSLAIVGVVALLVVVLVVVSSGGSPPQPAVPSSPARKRHAKSSEGREVANYASGQVFQDSTIRQYYMKRCGKHFTLSQLYPPFAAHQVEWAMMGRDRAWWSVHTGFPMTAEINDTQKAEFYASGVKDIEVSVKGIGKSWLAKRAASERAAGRSLRVLDFGCGLGRLVQAFARMPEVDEVVGIDQSVYHLRTARKEVAAILAPLNVGSKVSLVLSSHDILAGLIQVNGKPQCFDVVHSIIVLQHMIMPLQVTTLEQLCDVLKPGGRFFVQVPVTAPYYACTEAEIQRSIQEGGMQGHATPKDAIVELLARRGCTGEIDDVGFDYIHHPDYTSVVVRVSKSETAETFCE